MLLLLEGAVSSLRALHRAPLRVEPAVGTPSRVQPGCGGHLLQNGRLSPLLHSPASGFGPQATSDPHPGMAPGASPRLARCFLIHVSAVHPAASPARTARLSVPPTSWPRGSRGAQPKPPRARVASRRVSPPLSFLAFTPFARHSQQRVRPRGGVRQVCDPPGVAIRTASGQRCSVCLRALCVQLLRLGR